MANSTRRRVCPVCGTADPRRIVFGFPVGDLLTDPDVAIGGCIVVEPSPAFQCRNEECRHEFGRQRV